MKPLVAVVALLVSTQVASAAERISAVAVTRDGKSAVVASADRSLRVVALPDKRELRRLTFTEIPAAVALSPSGALLAVGGFGFLDLYELATGKQVAHVADPIGHLSINALAFSPDGKTLAAAGDAGRVKLFDGATAKELRAISGLSKIVNAVAFAPDGKALAVAGVDDAVSLFAVSGEPGAVLRAHKTWIAAMIFSIDGKQLVSADQNANVIVWDRASGKASRSCAATTAGPTRWPRRPTGSSSPGAPTAACSCGTAPPSAPAPSLRPRARRSPPSPSPPTASASSPATTRAPSTWST